jgi:hypothetical protein
LRRPRRRSATGTRTSKRVLAPAPRSVTWAGWPSSRRVPITGSSVARRSCERELSRVPVTSRTCSPVSASSPQFTSRPATRNVSSAARRGPRGEVRHLDDDGRLGGWRRRSVGGGSGGGGRQARRGLVLGPAVGPGDAGAATGGRRSVRHDRTTARARGAHRPRSRACSTDDRLPLGRSDGCEAAAARSAAGRPAQAVPFTRSRSLGGVHAVSASSAGTRSSSRRSSA